jgi:hypothetical protein
LETLLPRGERDLRRRILILLPEAHGQSRERAADGVSISFVITRDNRLELDRSVPPLGRAPMERT